jgi:SAM-dependent MidA family methyltransferase
MTWRRAMHASLYGPGGFYARGERPARHFRTSVHTSPRYADAVAALLELVDAALGRPSQLDMVDVGAGGGELLGQVCAAVSPALASRVSAQAVEIAPKPAGLDPRIRWCREVPAKITGLVMASEWLDNVPLDVAELTPAGPRLVQVDDVTGAERPGSPPRDTDLAWLDAWWPLRSAGDRAEIGRTRCEAWAAVIGRVERGLAVAADYGHTRGARPPCGTLTGYLEGRTVPPVPDGSRDITAHVALDACAEAGRAAGAETALLTTQRQALQALGVRGRLPPLELADRDPASYTEALCRASLEAELLDPVGLGGFGWLVQSVGMPLPGPLAALQARGTAAA